MRLGAARHSETLVALLVAGAFFMENLDGTVIATALPHMARSFHAVPVDLNIGMSSYLLTLGVFIPVSGWVADRFGARRVFGSAIVLFTLASMACGLTSSLDAFVAARVVQGIGGAMMVPVGRLIVLRNTPKESLIAAMATLTWPALVAPVLGPAVGGFLSDYASWRWIFFLNVPLGVAALVATFLLVPRTAGASRRPLDWLGFLLSGAGVAGIIAGLELVGRSPLPWPSIGLLLGTGAILLALAVRHFGRQSHPLLDLHSLRIRTFAVCMVGGSLFRMAIGAVPFLLPLLFQVGFGYDAARAGLLVMAVFAGNLLMKLWTTSLLRRFGFRTVMLWNGFANALTLAACATLRAETPIVLTCAILFVGGLCRSMQFTALNTLSFADVPTDRMNGANTLVSTAMQVTMGMGIAVGAVALRLGHAIGGTMPADAYRVAFLILGLIALAGTVDCWTLDRDAGAVVSGRRAKA
jgi:EmrB/QacA subfamily drug resistance transporter